MQSLLGVSITTMIDYSRSSIVLVAECYSAESSDFVGAGRESGTVHVINVSK